jgi:hypothetical protein
VVFTNSSTGFSGFQLCMGRSPHILPPLIPLSVTTPPLEERQARTICKQILDDEQEAKDMLLTNKISQAFHANKSRGAEDMFNVGDKVMLATLHCCWEYKAGDKNHVAKFFPRFDGPHAVTEAFADSSVYTLDLPNSPDVFPTFHAWLLKHFHENDGALFPSHAWASCHLGWGRGTHDRENCGRTEKGPWHTISCALGWLPT